MNDKIIRHSDKGKYAYSMMHSDGYTFDSQIHPFYEILYLNAGSMLYNVEGTDYMLGEGDMVFTLPYEMHSFSFPEPCRYERQFFHIYPALIEPVKDMIPDLSKKEPGKMNCIPAAAVSRYGLDNIFRRLEECTDPEIPETPSLMLAYAIEILSRLHAAVTSGELSGAGAPANANVRRILGYIDKNYTSHIDLSDIAEYMYMDRSYVGRLFKLHTGVSVMLYVNMKRIVLAKNMIMDGTPATEVYERCGFNDYSTFYRAFKRYVGVSPDKLRSRA